MFIGETRRRLSIKEQLHRGIAPRIANLFYRNLELQAREKQRSGDYEQVSLQNIILAGPGGTDVMHGAVSAAYALRSRMAGLKSGVHGILSRSAGEVYDRGRLEPLHDMQVKARILAFRVMTARLAAEKIVTQLDTRHTRDLAVYSRNSSDTRFTLDSTRDGQGRPLALNRATRLELQLSERLARLQKEGVHPSIVETSFKAALIQGENTAREALHTPKATKPSFRQRLLNKLAI